MREENKIVSIVCVCMSSLYFDFGVCVLVCVCVLLLLFLCVSFVSLFLFLCGLLKFSYIKKGAFHNLKKERLRANFKKNNKGK